MEFIKNFKNGNLCATLNISELKDMAHYDQIEPLMTFHAGTYVKLKESDGWFMVYGIVNQFMNQMSREHKEALVVILAAMHRDIIKFFGQNDLSKINIFIKGLNDKFNELDMAIDLCTQLRQYIVENVAIGLFKGAGERAQDSDDLTFYPDEVVDLTTICVLCKLMSPIFGTIMKNLNKQVDNKFREIHCFYIFTSLLERRYKRLYEKLEHYVTHTTKQTINNPSLTLLLYGFSKTSMSHQMFAELITRQFVNCDLMVKDGNLMTYVIVAVKRSIRTVMTNIGKNPAYNRIPIENKHDEDGNVAQLEIDSISTRKTTDSLAIIQFATQQAIHQYKNKYSINDEEFNASLAFYKRNPIVPNVINQDLASLFFQKEICGAKSIMMLKANEICQLITLLQLIVASLDVNYDELAHALTAVPALDVTVTNSIMDGRIKLNAGSSQYYRNCKQKFEASPFAQKGSKSWDFYMGNLVDQMVNSSWVYNTSDFVWDFLGQENKNGKIFTPTEKTFTALCSMYLMIWEFQNISQGGQVNLTELAEKLG